MTTQQTIDDANNKLQAAQLAYNSALSTQESKRVVMQDWYNLVVQCGGVGSPLVGDPFNRDACSHKSSGPCQSVSTCKSNVDTYNGYANEWKNAVLNSSSKKALLDAAAAYKDKVLKDAQTDPTFIAQQQQNANAAILAQKKIDEQKSRNRNIAIAVVIIVIVLVVAYFIWKKLK